ncbi:ArsR family transcriptional regulator [Desulfovibrio sp. JY]|nr:ArsR family transcriptional regulator [Desulfovibrio sp. JY]
MAEVFSQDRRLVILRLLAEDLDHKLNTSVLQDALDLIGHGCSRDSVETECSWLAEQGLVNVEKVGPVTVVQLTGRGQDVAEGRATVPGVKRPRAR